MVIIKRGKIIKTDITFKCKVCKCVFKAHKWEYNVNEYRSALDYVVQCPNCNYEVIKRIYK